MKENRAISILKSLQKDELRWFQKFVESPYHNSNQKLITLYGLLRKEYPSFSPAKTSPEILFKKIFTRKPYDAPTIRLLTHRLANLLEDFLISEQLKNDQIIRDKLLVKDLGERNAYSLFEKKTRNLLDDLEKVPVKDANYYRHRSDLHLQYYGHPATNRHSQKTEDLQGGMQNLDTYFTLSKLRLATAIQARKNTFAESYQVPFMKEVLSQPTIEHTLASLYRQVLNLQNTPDNESTYQKLRATFVTNIDLFNIEDQRLVLSVLLNFCARKNNQGATYYLQESFQLYKLALEKSIILYHGEITFVTYVNIVTSAIVNDEFSWSYDFIKEYALYLDRSVREEAKTYAMGYFYFHKKEFALAYDLLYTYKSNKLFVQISAKALLVRVNVELYLVDRSYFDLAMTQLSNFEKYLRNHLRDNAKAMEGYLFFIRYTRKFLKLKDAKQSLYELGNSVNESENLRLKNWLLEKINEKVISR